MIPKIKHNEVANWFSAIFATGDLCPLLLGGVGKGKTQLAYAYAKAKGLKPVTIYLDSMYEMDVIGYAVPNQEEGKFEYLPCGLFPLEGDPIPTNPDTGKAYKGFLIIFDEFGNCPKSMQVAAQRVINEKSIGSHKLHEKAKIVLLGNKVSSGANALPLSAAVRTRCGIAELETESLDSIQEFIDHMTKNKWHSSVITWAKENVVALQAEDPNLVNDGESPFTTWRGMEAVSNLMNKLQAHAAKTGEPINKLVTERAVVFKSIMGYTFGTSFVALVTSANTAAGYDEILTDPNNAQLPATTLEILKIVNFMVTSVVSTASAKNVVTYVNRLNPELRESMKAKLAGANVFIDEAISNANTVPI